MAEITFKSKWTELEKSKPFPRRANKVKIINYKEFEKLVNEQSKEFVNEITESLMDGNLYILKGAYSKKFMEDLKINTDFGHVCLSDPRYDEMQCINGWSASFTISKINLNFIYSTGLGYIIEDISNNDIGLFYGKCQKF